MASAATTANLGLPQWVAAEKPERTDFNAAFLAIDTTLAEKSDLLTYVAPATSGALHLQRAGNTVQLYAWAGHASLPTSMTALWETIPVGYRPAQALDRAVGSAWATSGTYTGYVPLIAIINTNGVVTVASTVASKTGCALNACWITNDAMPA